MLRAVGDAQWQFNTDPFFSTQPQSTVDYTPPYLTTSEAPLLKLASSSESSHNALDFGLVSWESLHLWPPEKDDRYQELSQTPLDSDHILQPVPPLTSSTHAPPTSRSGRCPEELSLPPDEHCASLIDMYFNTVHSFLPLLHEKTLRSSVAAIQSQPAMSRGLIFVVLTLASNERRDKRSRDLQAQWYEEAKSQYNATGYIPEAPIQTLQTAVCIVLQAMVSGDHSSMWLTLGKAWKQVVALGYHRIDHKSVSRIPGVQSPPEDWFEREAVRRIVWMLYILDRSICLPVGLDLTINENQLGINLPMCDASFQNSIISPVGATSISYRPNLNRLAAAVRESSVQTKDQNIIHYVLLNLMMLSRVVFYSQLEDDQGHDETFSHLEADLSALRISLPRSTTSVSAATYQDLSSTVWVNVLLNLSSIFLYYTRHPASGQISRADWDHCVVAARNTVTVIRQAATMSVDSLLNPHIASGVFLCGRILIIEYLIPCEEMSSPQCYSSPDSLASQVPKQHPGVQSLWRDIETLTLIFERLEELFGAIGTKFKNGMRYYLAQDARKLNQIKNSGTKDLLAECSSWEAGT